MLFNSFEFIFLFMPICMLVYFGLGQKGHYRAALAWLLIASLAFYARANPSDLLILTGSILFNYFLGTKIADSQALRRRARILLISGLAANLLLLGYYKYLGFVALNLAAVFPGTFAPLSEPLALPLGISFFTFLQIAYLVDSYRGATRDYDLTRYGTFVSFFPHLIAGPILHHAKIIPQLKDRKIYHFNSLNWKIGLTFFVIGLFKKVVVADALSPFSIAYFDGNTATLSFFEAWLGTLSYTLQLYYDFSAYSDMAIGLGFMFGIEMPVNFLSPYKATSIIEFWRRWHITLSAFLREYLYIPLGGNRLGRGRQMANLLITMVLAGIWHGAGWGFLIWGSLHGLLLVFNHLWNAMARRATWLAMAFPGRSAMAWAATFLCVMVGWVFFRSHSVTGAQDILTAMFCGNGLTIPPDLATLLQHFAPRAAELLAQIGVGAGQEIHYPIKDVIVSAVPAILLSLFAALFLPNAFEIVSWFKQRGQDGRLRFDRYALPLSIALGVMAYIPISLLGQPSEFLYFQF